MGARRGGAGLRDAGRFLLPLGEHQAAALGRRNGIVEFLSGFDPESDGRIRVTERLLELGRARRSQEAQGPQRCRPGRRRSNR